MMKPLRKRHLQIWTVLAVLIPAGIISGYLAVPKTPASKLLQADTTISLPITVKTINTNSYTASLRSSEDKMQYQLEWIGKEALTQPSSLIYKISNGEKELIGRVEANGNYFFPLKTDPSNNYDFILYDIIHKQITDSIKF